jgi:hypothetical protein
MTYTSEDVAADLAELRSKINQGVLKARFSDGREITYRSLDEMRRIEQSMAAEVAPTASRRVRRTYFSMSRPT